MTLPICCNLVCFSCFEQETSNRGCITFAAYIICVAFDSLISELLVSIQSNTLVSCGIESAEENGNGIEVFSFIQLIEVGFGLQRNSPQISVL